MILYYLLYMILIIDLRCFYFVLSAVYDSYNWSSLFWFQTSKPSSSSSSSSSTYQEVVSPNLHPAFPSSTFMPSSVIVTSPLQLQQLYAARFSNVHAAAYEEMVRQQLYAQLNSGTAVAASPMQIYPHLYKESQKSGATKWKTIQWYTRTVRAFSNKYVWTQRAFENCFIQWWQFACNWTLTSSYCIILWNLYIIILWCAVERTQCPLKEKREDF